MLTLNGETFEIGIRDGTYTKRDGIVRTTKDRDVIEWLDLTNGGIEVAHNDCIVRNCFVGATPFHSIYQLGGAQNLLVDMVTCNGRPDGKTNQNPSNSDFLFAHNKPMTCRRSLFIDAANDSVNFVGGLLEKSAIFYGGFTAGAHADAVSVHTTVAPFTAQKMYIDYRQYPNGQNVVPNATIKFVSVPSIGQSQNAGNGIAHAVSCLDSVCIGGGFVMYLDEQYSKVEGNVVDLAYWAGGKYGKEADGYDVYDGHWTGTGFKNNKNIDDVADDFAYIGSGGNPIPPTPPSDVDAAQWAAIIALRESTKADHDRLMALIENLHKV
jgi:hypothetical protein